MKHSIIRLLLFSVFLILTSFTKPCKVKFTSLEGKLSITFPSDYTSEIKETNTYITHKIQAVFEDQGYFLTYNIHQKSIANHTEMAQVYLNSFVESINGKIINQAEWKLKKHKGVKAILEDPTNNLKVVYYVILKDQLQYQIAVASEIGNWNQKNADKFFKSFKLKN